MRRFTSPFTDRRLAAAGLAALLASVFFGVQAWADDENTEISQAPTHGQTRPASVSQAPRGTTSSVDVGQIGAVSDPCVRPEGETLPARCATPELPLSPAAPPRPPPVTATNIDVDRGVADPAAPLTSGGVPAISVIAPPR